MELACIKPGKDGLVRTGTTAGYNAHYTAKEPVCEPCRDARKIYAKVRYDNGADKFRGIARKYYRDHREDRLEYQKTYNLEHPQERYEANLRVSREYKRAYSRLYLHARRARQKASGVFKVTNKDWRRLVDRYRGCCSYCGLKPEKLEQDHIIPISRGGIHSIGNLTPACSPCNKRKGKKLAAEFRYKKATPLCHSTFRNI